MPLRIPRNTEKITQLLEIMTDPGGIFSNSQRFTATYLHTTTGSDERDVPASSQRTLDLVDQAEVVRSLRTTNSATRSATWSRRASNAV